jgi:hypothetical protein
MGWLDAAIEEKERLIGQSVKADEQEATRRAHLMATTIGTTRGFDAMIRGHLTDVANATWKSGGYVVTDDFDTPAEESLHDHMAKEPGLPAYVWLAMSQQRSVFRVALYFNGEGGPAYLRSDDPPAGPPTSEGLGQNFPATEAGLETLLTEEYRVGPRMVPGTAGER